MPNQYTIAEAEGKEKPKGSNQFTTKKRERLDPKQRDAIRAEFAAKKLEAHAKGEVTLSDSQVAACKALMPYGKSTFASITEQQYEAPKDEQETLAALAHLIASNPALLKPLIEADPGVRAALKSVLDGQPVAVSDPDKKEIAA